MLHPKILNGIIDKVVKYYGPDKIIIFGSYAKEYNTQASDIDLMVIKDTPLPKEIRGREMMHLFFGHIIPIDFHFYTHAEFEEEKRKPYSLAHTIEKTGKIVYEKGN